MMRGVVQDMETGEPFVSADMGYSFCNCHNIFYTDKKHLSKEIYDTQYHKKYDTQNIKTLAVEEARKMLVIARKVRPAINTFFEVGAVNDDVLDFMDNKGLDVSGLDIIPHKSKHLVSIGDFEEWQTEQKFDFVWASHVFEHFTDPQGAISKLRDMLTDSGLLYIAMPDTFFIDFRGNPLNWDWNVREHYVLWGMDSFIKFCGEYGLDCIYKERNTDLSQMADKNWFWKKDFKVILCRR